MQSAKEKMNDAAASAKAGMEKTKDTFQEKVDKMTSRDPVEKDAATRKKEERQYDADLNKREAHHRNAAAAGLGGLDFATGGAETVDYGTPPAYNDRVIPGIAGEPPVHSHLYQPPNTGTAPNTGDAPNTVHRGGGVGNPDDADDVGSRPVYY